VIKEEGFDLQEKGILIDHGQKKNVKKGWRGGKRRRREAGGHLRRNTLSEHGSGILKRKAKCCAGTGKVKDGGG